MKIDRRIDTKDLIDYFDTENFPWNNEYDEEIVNRLVVLDKIEEGLHRAIGETSDFGKDHSTAGEFTAYSTVLEWIRGDGWLERVETWSSDELYRYIAEQCDHLLEKDILAELRKRMKE